MAPKDICCDPPYSWHCFEFLCSVRRWLCPRNAAFLFSSVAWWTNVSSLVTTHCRQPCPLSSVRFYSATKRRTFFCNAVIVITAVRTTHHNVELLGVVSIMHLSCLIRETTRHTQPFVMEMLGFLGRCLSSTCLTVMDSTTTYAHLFPWQ